MVANIRKTFLPEEKKGKETTVIKGSHTEEAGNRETGW
jgi:hypothetical protein